MTIIGCTSPENDITSTTGKDSTDKPSTVNYDELSMVWNDEFDGTEVDLKKWNYRDLGKRRNLGVVDKKTIELDGQGLLHIKVLGEFVCAAWIVCEILGIWHPQFAEEGRTISALIERAATTFDRDLFRQLADSAQRAMDSRLLLKQINQEHLIDSLSPLS